jgi:hypothetical protein
MRCCPDDSCPQHLQWEAFERESEQNDLPPAVEDAYADYDGDYTPNVPDGWDQVDG